MNLPDITLVFQMIHFWVAYEILKRLVFIPALSILNRDMLVKQQLQGQINQQHQRHLELIEQHTSRWNQIKSTLYSMIPQFNEKLCIKDMQITAPVQVEITKLSNDQKKSIQSMLEKELLDI